MATFYDEVKLAFGLPDAKKVLQATKKQFLKPPAASSPVMGGYAFIPTAASANRELTGFARKADVPREALSSIIPQQDFALGGHMVAPRRGDAARFFAEHYGNTANSLRGAEGVFGDEPALLQRVLDQRALAEKMRATFAGMSPEHRQLLEGVTRGHEQAEKQVRPAFGMGPFGHRSPDVILREQNAIATMPVGHPVREAMTAARQGRESEVLKGVGVNYGERRFSRHARKHLTNMIEQPAAEQLHGMITPAKMAAFLDELEKIGAARLHGRGVLSVRKGRRPISAANLLRKEKDGKLHKFQHVKEAATGGDSAGKPDDVSGGWADEGAAKPPRRPGELPPEVKSTTLSTKEGSLFDKARSMGAGAVQHATQAAKGHLHAGAEEIAAAVKPHVDAAAERLIEAGRKVQIESAPTVGAHAGRAAVDALKSDAKKVWDNHKGKIIGGAAAAYGANKAIDYSIQKHASFLGEFKKIAKPRWAKEIGSLVSRAQLAHHAGDPALARRAYGDAESVGRAMAGASVREVRPLGRGGNATGHLMVGYGVSTAEDPLVAVKHVSRHTHVPDVPKDLANREDVGRLLGADAAKSLGTALGPPTPATNRPWWHYSDAPMSGAHKQEYLPYTPSAEDIQRSNRHLEPILKQHGIRDVLENNNNRRLDRDFQPKVLDAVHTPTMSVVYGDGSRALVAEKKRLHAQALPTVLGKPATAPTKFAAMCDELAKIATVPGAMGSVNPMTTGENPLASPETRQKPSPGDIPTQDQSSNIPSRTESPGPQISTATGVAAPEYAPRGNQVRRRGDVPGMPKDPSAVDRLDGRESATTVTGLAQNSNNIGAFNSPAEHVG